MSGPAYVVMPVGVGNDTTPQDRFESAKIASAIENSLYEQTHPKPPALPAPPMPEENGPFKEIVAHQESLYKYISWEEPLRTLFSYAVALSVLIGFHYMPLTLWALKGGAYTLGAVSAAEFVSRSFGPDTFIARLRPNPYRKVPERILNATLKDVHDFIQYSVVQSQRVIFAQDLDKTFAAILTCTVLYWLVQIASPFALSIIGLTSLYIAPLLISPQGRELANQVAHDGSLLANDIANKAMDTGKSAIQTSKSLGNSAINQAQNMASATADTEKHLTNSAMNQAQHTANATAETGKSAIATSKSFGSSAINQGQAMADSTMDTTKSTYNKTKGLANDSMNQAIDATKAAYGKIQGLANDGINQAADQTHKARDTVAATSSRAGAAASNATGFGKEQAMDMKSELEHQPNYVVGRGDDSSGTVSSSVPRAGHREGHASEPSTTEDGRKAHVYSDPLRLRR